MKLDSKYFDSIRVAPRAARERRASTPAPDKQAPGAAAPVEAEDGPCCQWKGCANRGRHRAPMGRGREGAYFLFCMDHVREYNATYNYFDGMSDGEVRAFQKDAVTGHRPTWKVGSNAWAHGTGQGENAARFVRFAKQFSARSKRGARVVDDGAPAEAIEPRRRLKPLERKAVAELGLEESATADEIKARFKELVKLHHPDLNGGDKRSEDRLREIIQAYNHLKQSGLV